MQPSIPRKALEPQTSPPFLFLAASAIRKAQNKNKLTKSHLASLQRGSIYLFPCSWLLSGTWHYLPLTGVFLYICTEKPGLLSILFAWLSVLDKQYILKGSVLLAYYYSFKSISTWMQSPNMGRNVHRWFPEYNLVHPFKGTPSDQQLSWQYTTAGLWLLPRLLKNKGLCSDAGSRGGRAC